VILVVAALLALAAAACDSGSDATSSPTSTTRNSTTTSAPRKPEAAATGWRLLDPSTGAWPAALDALRSAPNPAAGARRMLPILRSARDSPAERITARAVAGPGDDALIWIARRGLADDSTTGVDVRIDVTGGTNGVEILTAAIRSICARGRGVDGHACL
jgi:hypothetical protein